MCVGHRPLDVRRNPELGLSVQSLRLCKQNSQRLSVVCYFPWCAAFLLSLHTGSSKPTVLAWTPPPPPCMNSETVLPMAIQTTPTPSRWDPHTVTLHPSSRSAHHGRDDGIEVSATKLSGAEGSVETRPGPRSWVQPLCMQHTRLPPARTPPHPRQGSVLGC